MLMDHEEDVAELARAAQSPGASPVESFAAESLPTLTT